MPRSTEFAGHVVGRDAELAALKEFLETGRVRRGLVIVGDAGIGKTTIVRAALESAPAAGLRVFSARPAEGEVELPYVGLGDLLATVQSEALATLSPPQRSAVEAALGRERSSTAVDRQTLSRGVLELIRFEGARGDLLIVVDDVQWLDRPTSAAMFFALRRLGPVPVRVLVAARTANGALGELPLGLGEWEDARLLHIGPLTTTEIGVLVRERFGERLARPDLKELRRASGGNPMFALELARARGERRTNASALSSALRERLRGVNSDARTGAAFVAAALRPTTALLMGAGVKRAELKAALEAGLIEADGDRLLFVHPLLREVAAEFVLPDERRAMHARLALASTDAVERGHHVSRSTVIPDEEAASILDEAAEEASSLGDHAGAAAFLRRAAELSFEPQREKAWMRELGAAGELELAGDVEAAAALAHDLVERLPTGALRARARQLAVFCSLGPDLPFDVGLAELALALADADGAELVQAELHLSMAELSSGLFRFTDAIAHAQAASTLAERNKAGATAVAALSELGVAECMFGHGVTQASRAAFERWDRSYLSATNSPGLNLAIVLMITTAFEQAEDLLAQESARAEERGMEAVEAIARGVTAEVQLRAGNWAAALENARPTFEHARQATIGQGVTAAAYAVAMTKAVLGEHEEAGALSTTAVVEADATQDAWHRLSHRAVLGLIALTDDRPQDAVDVLTPAWALMLDSELGDLSILPIAQVLAESLVAVGLLDDALGVATALRDCPVGTRPWCRAMASRCEALVASVRGDHDAARTSIAAALDAHAELPEPFEHARTLYLKGRVERTARGWGAARAALTDALERFDTLGAARWAEKAAADLARLPGRRPGDRQDLTTRESEVAELVATGLSNKEVATRLFLSVRTVEATLSKTYAKLGVRSRTELAGRITRPRT